MNIKYSVESFKDIWNEIEPIIKDHWEEIAHYKDIPLNVDKNQYFELDGSEYMKTFTAREDGVLVGYNIFFIRHNMHYKNSLQAINDVIYIKKEKRGFGKYFIKWCDDELRNIGIQLVGYHIKFSHDWSKVLDKMGYDKPEFTMIKRLDLK